MIKRTVALIRVIEFRLFPDALGLDITGPLEVFSTATAVGHRRGSAGRDSIERIALASRFGREERLRRAFLRRFKVTPPRTGCTADASGHLPAMMDRKENP